MSSVTFGFTAKQIINEGRVKQDDIDHIKSWLTTQNLPKLTDEQIVQFLLSCCNEQEPTKITIKAFNSTRNATPGYFTNRILDREQIRKQLNIVYLCILPKRTNDGCVMIYCRLNDRNFWRYDMQIGIQLLFMLLDAAIHDHPPNGLVVLFDMKGISLMHLTRVRYNLVKSFFTYVQEGLPVKLKIVHIFNSVYFLEKVLSIVKPFIKKEVMDLIHFHPPTLDMETFYEKCVPKECLLEDLGGDLPSAPVLHEATIKKLTDMQPHFEAEERQRLGDKKFALD